MLINSLFILLKVSAVLLLEHALPPLLIKAKCMCVFIPGKLFWNPHRHQYIRGHAIPKPELKLRVCLLLSSMEFGLLETRREGVTLCLPHALLMNTHKGLYHYHPLVNDKRECHVCTKPQ